MTTETTPILSSKPSAEASEPDAGRCAVATGSAFASVVSEVERATRKFPTWPTDPLHALAVLGEEFGELTKEMLQLTYEPHKTNPAEVRKEAVQCAAMAMRLLMSLDTYEYRPGVQHSQNIASETRGPLAPNAENGQSPRCL